jgi:glutamate racemase
MKNSNHLPIGVFDSGLGGLTVVRELSKRLPHEDIIYVGDTARVPYGTKSPDTVRRYALQISFFLIQKKVKALVVACNTVSAVALQALKNLPIPVFGVIDPGSRAAVLKTKQGRIGIIGTPATVASHAYKTTIQSYSPSSKVWEEACPLLVPLVEVGWHKHSVTREVVKTYLKPLLKKKIDTLVLGCTHYPLLKETISSFTGPRISLIDSAEETASDVATFLKKNSQASPKLTLGKTTYFVTDNPASFSRLGGYFLGHKIPPARRLRLDAL